MIKENFVQWVVIICWLIFPCLWVCHRMNWFIKLSIWWKAKDKNDVILPCISFFILPFFICVAYQGIYEVIHYSSNNYNFAKVLDTVIKLIPIATIGAYFLNRIKDYQEIQSSKDMLSYELFQNYLTTRNTLSLLQVSKCEGVNVQGKPIQCFQSLWSNKAYENSFSLIIKMKENIYNNLNLLYNNANLIINLYAEDDKCSSYASASDNDMLITRLSFLIDEIYNNLILLNNKSEIGLLILKEVQQIQQER